MNEEEETDDSSLISETASSSGLSNCEVSIFCHNAVFRQVDEAEKIFVEKEITTSIAGRDSPASRPKLSNLYSLAKHSRLRVFLITDGFLQNDFNFHLRLLENANLCSKRNTLLLLHERKYLQYVPEYLRDLPCKYLNKRITADDIVKEIVDFRNSLGIACYDVTSDPDTSKSDDTEYQPVSHSIIVNKKKERMEEVEMEFSRFKGLFGKITKKRCYILISSPIRARSPSLSSVTSVPWMRVFDFDNKSSTHGLYLWAQEGLSKKNVIKTTRPDHIETPDDDAINWISVIGTSEDDPEHSRSIDISENAILRHGESLADYCIGRKIPIILVMWYPSNSNLDKTLDDFLTGMRHHLKGRLNSFECIVCVDQLPNKKSPLHRTLDRLGIINNAIRVPVDVLCDWIKQSSEPGEEVSSPSYSSKTLPKYTEDGEEQASVDIPEEELLWIRSHVYILVKSQGARKSIDNTSEALKSLGTSFLKGRRIHWDVLENGNYDVDRDLLDEVKSYIESKHISTGRSGLITILHAPGGGGTTFARRLLHELRNLVPCGELISERFSVKNLEERLIVLRNLTFLPTILLLDGNSMHDVKKILAMEAKVRIILVHVRRYISEYGKNVTSDSKFFLDAQVSATESQKFANVYIGAVPQKSPALMKLSKNTTSKPRYIFEYGMTAFKSQFVGVRQYVHGYLQLQNADDELQNWHTVLVFLSMANYYGHRGLPCKLFSKMLMKSDRELVDIDDLPHAAQQFITEEDDSWKITHYVVSKLIIEQVLVRRNTPDYLCPETSLSREACKELSKWALKFINNISEYVGVSKQLAPHIYEILTSVFIRRNYDEPGEVENSHKTHFSKVIEEIRNTKEQESIFQTLVKRFPGQAEFKAHLGRFYSKQNKFDQAEECFKQAIEVRRQELRTTNGYETGPAAIKPDDVMQRIFNMSGFACISNIRSEIGVRLGKLSPRKLKGKNLPKLIRFCLYKASTAISNFEKGRSYYQKSSNPSFANIGELKVRLQLSELAKYIGEDNLISLRAKEPPYSELATFALESFHECDRLLAECIADRDIDIPEDDLHLCFNSFNYFFKDATEALKNWAGNDTSMHSLKCRLSILKVKLKQDSRSAGANANRRYFRIDEDIKNADDISNLIQLNEKICDTVFASGSTMRISIYMMEWLRLIRHQCATKCYSQVDVHSRVEKWRLRNERGSLSDFYSFLLSTTLSISSLSREMANVYAEKSHKLRDLIKHNDSMPIYAADTSEWLGKNSDQDFNRLIHHTAFGEWNGKFWTDPDKISNLQVCSGSIQYCRPHDGIIILDGGRDARIPVFFVPHRYGIGLSHSKRKSRVEFYLAFNTRHLAEAYEVRLLETFSCPNPKCKMPTEISRLGRKVSEMIATCNACESEVKIP